ncbi:unnamed protein product [Leptidea sinapis]|uniref:Uncharacterized protein n=1 Tax=Leptidea sinapis TaxID=189913 RepID=A0A5E4QAD2_9NEOP|nr:unnamed protein product [Leptidea sinapis]
MSHLHGLGDLVVAAAGLLQTHERAAQQTHGGLLGHGAALQAHALVVIKDEVKAISSQFNLIQESYQVLQNEHHDLKQDVVKLQVDIVEKDDEISELRHSINKQQQWCRQSNIEIVGLPEAPNENPKTLMVEIAKHAGLELSFDEIEFAHRVQPFKSTPKPTCDKVKRPYH